MAIREIKHKGLEQLFHEGTTRLIGKEYHGRAIRILDRLNAAPDLRDCHGFQDFHPLKGDRKGQYAMHVSGNYVVTFSLDGTAFSVLDFLDYH